MSLHNLTPLSSPSSLGAASASRAAAVPAPRTRSGARVLRARFARRPLVLSAVTARTDRAERIELKPGRSLMLAADGGVWRVTRGMLRVAATPSAPCQFLAAQGDVIGLESHLGHQLAACAISLTDVTLERVASIDAPALTAQVLLQSRRQCDEMLRLRSGSIVERLRYLLLLLAQRSATEGTQAATLRLPRLKDAAAVVDSTVETVCRTYAALHAVGEPVAA
ncbi:MAG: hypothetical protein JNL19_12465 [Burkholderiales bacterium]|nr:hypothetical protein [Burkholderiales bacterium]